MCQISGYAREELIGRDFRGFLDEDSKRLVSERYLLRQQGDEPPVRYEFNIICKNGEKRRVEISPSLIEDSKGNLRTVAQLLDITEQKLDEQKLKLSNSVLSAIRDINQLINRERNLHRLLQGTCYRLTSISSCESAWVVLLDDAGRIGSFAEAGLGPEFSSMIEKMQGGQLPPCGEKALSSPEVVTVEDPAAMCRNCPLAYNCVKRSVMTARLEHGSKTYGFIAVSLSGKLGLGGEGCALFGELARDIAFALHDAELEQKRVRTEDEIRALNQFRESIIENANVWIDVVDKEGNVLVWNKAAEQLSGYPHEVVVGDNKIWEWLYPDEAYREQVNAKLDQVLGQGQILENFETTIRCKDGTIKTISWNERNLTGIDGRATGSIAVGRDVTVHKQMEDEIESRRLYLEAVLATVPDALVTLDSDYRITEWSSGAERLFGYSRKEAIGRDIDELITMPEEIEQAKALSKLVLSGKYMPPTELVRYRKGGQPINVIFAGAPLLVRSKFIGAVAAYTEITARVEAEKKLRETSNKIERLHSIARQLEACSNEDDVYRLTVEAAEQILTFSMCSLDILEEGKLVVKATTSGLPPGASKEIGLEHWEHGGLAAKTFLSGESTVFGHLSEVPEARPTREDFKSGISAPIGDIGVFQVVSTEPGAFSEEDKRLLELLLGHTVEAVKRIRLQEALKEQAIHDALTGVYNRHFFNERIKEEVERSRRYSHPIAFIMLDVNRFKEINDRFGHLQGDRVLKMVADVLKKEVRDTDFVIRYGGDEFLIVLPETSNEADAVVQRVREALARRNEEQPIVEFPVTLGAGISHCDPGFERPLEEILTDADRRMYQDKKA
jgi:diguanylate cyclase (GGDEF)-like protein/PAS domain S-box-containing protein